MAEKQIVVQLRGVGLQIAATMEEDAARAEVDRVHGELSTVGGPQFLKVGDMTVNRAELISVVAQDPPGVF